MKWIAVPFLLFAAFSTAAAGECPAPGSAVELFGTIGKDLRISMNLTFQNERLSGSYAYVKYEKNIPLSGICTGGSLTLQESDASGRPTAFFRGSFAKPQTVEGTWSTVDGKKSLPFHLQAILPTDRVSGKYKMGGYLDKKTGTGAELDILLLGDGRVRIQGDALWVNPANPSSVHTGDVDGTAKLEGDKAYYRESPDDPDSCRFRIWFSNRTITVTDDNRKCGGMNVTFEGTYQRVGPPTFFEEPLR
jgi:hypothetical protein